MERGLKKFHIGQKVKFLQDVGGGVVISILENDSYKIEDEDGFSAVHEAAEMVPIHGEKYEITYDSVSQVKDSPKTKKIKPKTEIDLHIEELTESSIGLTNTEILMKQMFAFKSFYKRAELNKQRLIVAIHGVGEGVLRNEIRTFLDGKNNVEYYDADYSVYGYGATAIRIYYNY